MSKMIVSDSVEELKKDVVEAIRAILIKTTTEKRQVSVGLSGILFFSLCLLIFQF